MSVIPSGYAYVGENISQFGTFTIDVKNRAALKDNIKWDVTLGTLVGTIVNNSRYDQAECYATMQQFVEGKNVKETFHINSSVDGDKFSGEFSFPAEHKRITSVDEYNIRCFINQLPTFLESTSYYSSSMIANVVAASEISGTSQIPFGLRFSPTFGDHRTASGSGVPLFEGNKGFRFDFSPVNSVISTVKVELLDGFFHSPKMDDFPEENRPEHNYVDGATDIISCDLRVNGVRHLREELPLSRRGIVVSFPEGFNTQNVQQLQLHCPVVGVTNESLLPVHVVVTGNENHPNPVIGVARVNLNSATTASVVFILGAVFLSAMANFF